MEQRKKRIALAANENQMCSLLEWARFNRDLLVDYELYAVGSAIKLLADELDIDIIEFQDRLLNYNQQSGLENRDRLLDLLVFFQDSSTSLSDDPDIEALLRVATTQKIPIAGNRTAADFMFPAHLMATDYDHFLPNNQKDEWI